MPGELTLWCFLSKSTKATEGVLYHRKYETEESLTGRQPPCRKAALVARLQTWFLSSSTIPYKAMFGNRGSTFFSPASIA